MDRFNVQEENMSKKVIIVIILVIAAAVIVNYYPEKITEIAKINISDLSSDHLDNALQDLEQVDFNVPS